MIDICLTAGTRTLGGLKSGRFGECFHLRLARLARSQATAFKSKMTSSFRGAKDTQVQFPIVAGPRMMPKICSSSLAGESRATYRVAPHQ